MNETEYQRRVAQIDEWAKALGFELADLIEPNPADVIYHYTNSSALIGMLESGKIWATHVSRMNDSMEYKIGIELVEQLVRKNMEGQLRQLFERAISNLVSVETYIACYSSEVNRLGQWRAYAELGVGYCIGFKSGEMATTDGRMPLLEKVIYSEEVAEAVVVRLLGRVEELLAKSDFGEVEVGYLLGMLEATFNSVACVVKHAGFKEEAEYRQIYQPSTSSLLLETKFRSGRYSLTPYVEFDLLNEGRLPIESITIGPCADPDEESYTLAAILSRHGYQSVDIQQSGIPLRV